MFDTRIHDVAISYLASPSSCYRSEQKASEQEAARLAREARRAARGVWKAGAVLKGGLIAILIGGVKRV